MTTVIKANSKVGKRYLQLYEYSYVKSVKGIYKKPSSKKIAAEALCIDKMVAENGRDYKILCASFQAFTAAWEVAEGLRVETACHSYLIK